MKTLCLTLILLGTMVAPASAVVWKCTYVKEYVKPVAFEPSCGEKHVLYKGKIYRCKCLFESEPNTRKTQV